MVKVKVYPLGEGDRWRAEVVGAEDFFMDGNNHFEAVGRLLINYGQRFPGLEFDIGGLN